MFSIDCPLPVEDEEDGIESFATNPNSFRTQLQFGDWATLPHRNFDSFRNAQEYQLWLSALPPALFIDLGDVYRYLRAHKGPGIDAIDIGHIAMIVCDFLGDHDYITETLYTEFDSEITSEVTAALGVEYDNPMMQEPFDKAINLVMDVAMLIQRYLVNTGYPLIEKESVYSPGLDKNGLVGLRLKTYEQLATYYAAE